MNTPKDHTGHDAAQRVKTDDTQNLLLEIMQRQRRIETRMVRLMNAHGLDEHGRKVTEAGEVK